MENLNQKLVKYEKIIIDLLNAYKRDDEDAYLIIDKQSRHYQLLVSGWSEKNAYFCRILMHFHLREDGIICLFENHTEEEVGDTLMNQGVPKSDILVRFLPQSARQYAGYAAV
jgi:hypothetical protein